jgi:hypothetical protein
MITFEDHRVRPAARVLQGLRVPARNIQLARVKT